METDYQKVYNNLTVLLDDICQFLSSDKLGSLSHRDKRLVESLITRSKVQLQEISKLEKLSACEEYVDMDSKKVDEEEDEKLEDYSCVDDVNKNSSNGLKEAVSSPYPGDVNKNQSNVIQEIVPCPYTELPARTSSQNVKYGFISMKKKFLLFEKMKRVYAVIHNRWLLIYYTEKDSKPHCTFYLKYYEAKEADGSKNTTTFELINSFDRKKMYFFMALTPKDMLQWVVNINRCHDNAVVQGKGLDLEDNDISLEEDDGEHYDIIMPGCEKPNADMEEEDDIYLELDDLVKPSQKDNRISRKIHENHSGPPLPGRPQRGGQLPVPIPPKPSTPSHSSESSLASYDDISEFLRQPEPPNLDETSDDEMYQEFVDVKQKIIKMSNPLPIENKDKVKDSNNALGGKEAEEIDEEQIAEVVVCENAETHVESVNVKDKIEMYKSNSPIVNKNLAEIEEGFRNKSSSFVQDIIKKSNFQLKPSFDSEPTNRIINKECKTPTSDSKNFKSGAKDSRSPAFESKKIKIDFNDSINKEPKSPSSNVKDFKDDSNEAANTSFKFSTPLKPLKRPGGLSPPVIKKVPTVPLKPKIRDKPFIANRPPLSSFRQMTED